MNIRQKATLYHELGKLLGAGLNLDRSTEILLDQSPPAKVRQYLQGLQKGLAEHCTAAGAIAKHNHALVGGIETTLVEAGERGGRLDEAFIHLGSYFDLRRKAQSKAMGALIYPILLLHVAVFVPDLGKIMAGGGLSGVLHDGVFRLAVAWFFMALTALLWRMASDAAAKSTAVDSLLRALPLIGPTRRHWALARFCQVFETGLMAALKISEAVRLAGSASQSAVLDKAAKHTADGIEHGGDLYSSVKSAGGFTKTFVNAIHTAEASGTLDDEMRHWALAEMELAAQSQDRAAEWLPRIFYVLIVLYVASRIIGSFMGLYGPEGVYGKMLKEMSI